MDGWDFIDEWWNLYTPMPADPTQVESGKRAPLNSSGYMTYPGGVKQLVTKGNRQTGACQYWINGLASVCSNWDPETLRCKVLTEPRPSGYGLGKCDMLGRRSWCTHYVESKPYDPNEFACVLPCIERSGKGKQVTNDYGMSLNPILPKDIQGYNEQNGIGTCDGLGMGRGTQGPFNTVEEAWAAPVVCRFYRPQMMGFGAYQPRPYHGSDVPGVPFTAGVNWVPQTLAELHDGSPADPLTYMSPRLPFGFQVYNSRAMFQICAHWGSNRPALFEVGSWGDNPHDFTIDLDEDPSGMCECTDSASNPYKQIIEEWDEMLPPMLQYVWAKYGGVVCNGAKPECPCYSGMWIYCTDANMKDGMRISAEQIMELRFWASNWESQAEYEAFYAKKPGPTQNGYSDETTSAIFTFKEWEMIDNKDPNKSKMRGVKVDLCQPVPLHLREFDPDVYLKKQQITYPTMDGYTGTNIREQGVLYPTLLRELDPPPDYIPDLLVIYPYQRENPWDVAGCDEAEDLTVASHDFNLMYSEPYISVIGYGPKKSEVYVLNANLIDNIGEAKSFMDQYSRAAKIPSTSWDSYIAAMQSSIDWAEESNESYFIGVSNTAGFFHIDNVKLELNMKNTLYIICKYADFNSEDGVSFTYRRIEVESRFWGALITQDTAVHSPAGDTWENNFPQYYNPSIYISGQVHVTRGEVATVLPAYFMYVYSIVGNHKAYYSYMFNRHYEVIPDVEKWVQVGPTGYIWAEIDNIDINYMMDFVVDRAYMIYNVPEDEAGNRIVVGMCGNDPNDPINLEVVYPSVSNAEVDRHTIPPNAVLLKAPQPLAFFKSRWKLVIEYHYDIFDTELPGDSDDVETSWPVGFNGGYFAQNVYSPSKFNVQHAAGDTSFNIPSIGGLTTRGTPKVIAFVRDENGRYQTAAATKLLMQGQQVTCRSVDIFYSYAADATAYDLQPSTGFFTWRGAPKVNESTSTGLRHSNITKCGDHLCGGECPPGYMWFPFNACSTESNFYNELNGAAYCTMRISEGDEQIALMGPGAVRYGVVNEYNAWVTPGGNWASSCGAPFYYHYSRAQFDSVAFSGRAYKKAKIDKWYYIFREWALPPFGNTGRGAVERYLTRDFSSHVSFEGPIPVTSYRHMPHVVDIEDLTNQSLNCFEISDRYSLASDPFSCFPMLSNYVFSDLSEEVSEDRLRWDEILQVIYHGNCMYPWPLLENVGVQRYGFLHENHIWAWPEYWKPIERNLDSTNGQLRFIDVRAQEYYFDYVKEEHRFVSDEGEHVLIFIPPTGEEGDGEGDTKAEAFPSVSLDGAYPRYFNIVYDNYDSQMVDWKDEGDTGEENSSGGDGTGLGERIYELTCLSETQDDPKGGAPDGDDEPVWIHNYNTIFDHSASITPNEDRKAFVGESFLDGRIYAYYNRGLIAHIPRNRLYFLPMEESPAGDGDVWEDPTRARFIYTFGLGFYGMAPTKITVTGNWGTGGEPGQEEVFSKAGISVRENTDEVGYEQDGSPIWSAGELVNSVVAKYGSSQTHISRYSVTLELPKTPKRFTKTWNHFMVSVTSYGDELLDILSIEATLGKYVRAEETIKVWERMYHPGVATLPDGTYNADGPKTKTFRDYDRDRLNAGQYFPFNEKLEVIDPELEGAAFMVSKTNMVGVTQVFTEDEEVKITMANMKDKENDIQEELYQEAYDLDGYDELSYTGIRPPAIDEWLKDKKVPLSHASAMRLNHYKTKWENNEFRNKLRQEGTYWQPGGHFFQWSSTFTKTRCYVFGPIQEVYSCLWVHHKHGGVTATLGAGESYMGWGRLWYYEGRLANLMGLGQFSGGSTDSLTGAKNGVFTESR